MRVSLSRPTEQHPDLVDIFTSVPIGAIQHRLKSAVYVGGGGFCKVYALANWDLPSVAGQPSPCFGQPVIIKLTSAGFRAAEKRLVGDALQKEEAHLQAHYNREKNAHLVLEGQPRVVQVFHTFQGCLLLPRQGSSRELVPMQVFGFVEERCSLFSLNHLLTSVVAGCPLRRSHVNLEFIAAQMSALAEQLRVFEELGITHQDVNVSNILAHEEEPGSGNIVLKLGDLNLAQWHVLTRDGNYWGGTVGYMPRRVQRLYKGGQYPLPGIGEVYHDVFSLGKVLLRLLEFLQGLEPPFVRSADDLEAEDASVKQAAVELLMQPVIGEAPQELYAFGVLIGLAMCWDGEYTGKRDILRLAPAAAAEVLANWSAICNLWSKSKSEAFWQDLPAVDAMARLYLKLMDYASLPPLDGPRVAGRHLQEDEYITEVAEDFFFVGEGEGQRLAAVKLRAAELLAAAEQARAAAPAVSTATALGGRQQRGAALAGNNTWVPDSVAGALGRENAVLLPPGGAGGKRKHSSMASVNQAPRRLAVQGAGAAGPVAAAALRPAAVAAAVADETICLSHDLKLRDLFPNGIKPRGAPVFIGTKNRTVHALAQAVQSMLAGGPNPWSSVVLRPGGAAAPALSLRLADVAGRRGRQVVMSRREFEVLAGDATACTQWNAAMKLLTASYTHQKADVRGRVAILTRDLGAVAC